MSESKHTPSPWVVLPPIAEIGEDGEPTGAFTDPGGIEGADGSPVCIFGDPAGSGTMFENEDDRPLIAASPDMLAALKKFVSDTDHAILVEDDLPESGLADALRLALAAIAKAEGRA